MRRETDQQLCDGKVGSAVQKHFLTLILIWLVSCYKTENIKNVAYGEVL